MKFYVLNTSSDKVSVNYSLSLGLLKTEHKLSIKKTGGPVSDRSTGRDFKFYRSGRENPDRFHLWSVDKLQIRTVFRIILKAENKYFCVRNFNFII